MGFADAFKRVMGVRQPDPAELRRAAWRQALDARDEVRCLEAALNFSQAQMFDDALAAFAQLETLYPARKAEWLRWQGQTLYISMSWRAPEAERAALYQRALEKYFAAAELGDLSQEMNVVELCEFLCLERGVQPERKRALLQRYLDLFPAGEHRRRGEELLSGLA